MAKLSSTDIYGDLYVDGVISGVLNTSGNITMSSNNTYIYGKTTSGAQVSLLRLTNGNVTDVGNTSGHTCLLGNASPTYYNGSTTYTLYHTGNKPSATDVGALPIGGGTMTGKITTPNNAQGIQIGDDVILCDRNIADHLVLEGSTATNGGITFGSGKDTNIYRGGANILKTDDTMNAVGGFQWNGQSLDSRYAAASHGTHLTIGTGSGNAAAGNHTHNAIVSRGNVTCESGITARPAVAGLSMTQAYNNGYPSTYGNVINLRGTGDGQLFIGWSGTDGAHAPVYVRSKRDNVTSADWSPWAQIYTSANPQTTINGLSFWTGTQGQYDALPSKSATTVYLIKE